MRVALLALGLAGCTSVPTDPARFSLEPQAVSQLRAPQAIAVLNTYRAPAVTKINNAGWTADFQTLTESATVMLRSALAKRGITSAQPEKTISLRVLRAGAGMGGGPMMTTAVVQLGAQLGDGTRVVVDAQNVGFSGERALDGALLFALNKLVGDEKFVAYVNGDVKPPTACVPRDTYVDGEYVIAGDRMVRIVRTIGDASQCKIPSRPLALEVRIATDDERENAFTHCTFANVQPGDKLNIGPYASSAKPATVQRVLGPSPRCDDPQRNPTRVEARFDK